MKKFVLALMFVGVTSLAPAQTGTPASKLAYDQSAATLAEAQAFTYKYYPDGSATGTTLTSVVCSGATAPYTCVVSFPAFTPGTHTLQLTAANVAGESVKSAVFSFTFVVQPTAPANIRIQ